MAGDDMLRPWRIAVAVAAVLCIVAGVYLTVAQGDDSLIVSFVGCGLLGAGVGTLTGLVLRGRRSSIRDITRIE